MSPATEAFKKAIEVLQRDMSRSDCEIIWLRGKNSMLDVQKALLDAETTYKNQSSKSKIRTVLASCSSRVAYYARMSFAAGSSGDTPLLNLYALLLIIPTSNSRYTLPALS